MTQQENPRKIKWLVVHCTAGHQTETIPDLTRWFKQMGWKNPGYHYVISPDGGITNLQPENLIANGVAGHNANSIHISYIGGIDKDGKPIDNRTIYQKNSFIWLLKKLKKEYPAAEILGHRDFSPDLNHDGIISKWEYIKMCPCFDAKPEYAFIT